MDRWLRRIVAKIDQSYYWKRLWIPLIAVAPTTLVASSKYYKVVEEFFNAHPYIQFFAVFWITVPIIVSGLYHRFQTTERLSGKQVIRLLRLLSHIVGKKVERFAEKAKTLRQPNRRFKAKEVFQEITQPETQIREIVQGIWTYFEASKTEDSAEIRVAFAKMGSLHIESFECFYPSNRAARTAVSVLQNPEAGFSTAKRTKRILVVEDVVAESKKTNNRRYLPSEDATSEGSMICYPIMVAALGECPYVLSICASKKEHFKESDKQTYEIALELFAERIVLEYCLKVIKENAR